MARLSSSSSICLSAMGMVGWASAGTKTTPCTTTMTLTYSRLPTPPYWPQCSGDGTLRVYPTTTTVCRPVDCHGCGAVEVREQPEVHCPAIIITATATEATPTTQYRTVCSVSA
ncbi:hypothetical protein HIM_00916 [Hirsutella minnesotensis 3608]|nr:hypothetical protein HIM_00916 [Hirsutella minnesotensis 3608]